MKNHDIVRLVYEKLREKGLVIWFDEDQMINNVQKQMADGPWALFSGDINQDENVDLLDLSILDSSISNFDFGYVSTDINGDSNVDLLDNPIIEENINQFIFSVHP
jgi:hypothetical protein